MCPCRQDEAAVAELVSEVATDRRVCECVVEHGAIRECSEHVEVALAALVDAAEDAVDHARRKPPRDAQVSRTCAGSELALRCGALERAHDRRTDGDDSTATSVCYGDPLDGPLRDLVALPEWQERIDGGISRAAQTRRMGQRDDLDAALKAEYEPLFGVSERSDSAIPPAAVARPAAAGA